MNAPVAAVRTRVLIVDDSVVARRFLTDAVCSDPTLEVVGTAATGAIALQKIPQLSPEIVLLDVEMPDMDGLETVERIRTSWPKVAVIMCSSLTVRGADTTLRALAAGASDCIAKPDSQSDQNVFRAELCGKIGALGRRIEAPLPAIVRPAPIVPRVKKPQHVCALAIGCSTGGPNALATVFAALPRELGIPTFIVQHMPPLFTKLLADRLAASTGISVVEATHGERVEPNRTYIAPGDHHMTVTRDLRISLDKDVHENSCRPAVDPLFRSVARVYGDNALGVVMTGMGQDGMRGARVLVEAGGVVIVQDAATSVVPSMPGAVANEGLADGVYPLERIALEIVARVRRKENGDRS